MPGSLRGRRTAAALTWGWDCARLALAGGYLSAVIGFPPAVDLLLEPAGWLLPPSVEVAALAAVLAALSALGCPRLGRGALSALALALLAVTLLGGADLLVHAIWDRPLNLPMDVAYVPFLIGFLAESAGAAKLAAVAAAVVGGAALLLVGNLWALGTLAAVVAGARGRAALAGLAALVLAAQAVWAEPPDAGCPTGSGLACRPWQLASKQLQHVRDLWRPLPGLDGPDPYAATAPRADLRSGLGGADVVLAFVESYGETALRRPDYAAVVGPALAEVEAGLRAADLSAVSGYLVSPTVGGLSWLAHGTLLSGIWLESDLHYKRLIRGGRTTLVEDFNRAGYRTLGVFPQIERPWPEGRFFRYDEIHTGATIPYDGPPFGWTTMPDQYSLWFVEQQRQRGERPVFIELALISSHAPWEPIPPLIHHWEELGANQGEVFRDHGGADGPKNWPHDATLNYPKAVAYSLRALGAYAARFLDDGALLILLGDHQPASLITGGGKGASRAVPVHVIARNPALLEPFRAWGFTDGVVPGDEAAAHRMDRFRGHFLAAFGGGRAVPP